MPLAFTGHDGISDDDDAESHANTDEHRHDDFRFDAEQDTDEDTDTDLYGNVRTYGIAILQQPLRTVPNHPTALLQRWSVRLLYSESELQFQRGLCTES